MKLTNFKIFDFSHFFDQKYANLAYLCSNAEVFFFEWPKSAENFFGQSFNIIVFKNISLL